MPATNRIVVDYGGERKLVLLAKIHTQTGAEFSPKQLKFYADHGFEVAKQYDGIKDIAQLKALEEPNKEGFVLHFASGLRLKAKFADYVRLHRLLTQCSTRTIWDALRTGQSLDDVLERVPDEFYAWVRQTRDDLLRRFAEIEASCTFVAEQVRMLPTRKDQAALVVKEPYPSIIFLMLDNKPYREAIWRALYPAAERPFRVDEEVA